MYVAPQKAVKFYNVSRDTLRRRAADGTIIFKTTVLKEDTEGTKLELKIRKKPEKKSYMLEFPLKNRNKITFKGEAN